MSIPIQDRFRGILIDSSKWGTPLGTVPPSIFNGRLRLSNPANNTGYTSIRSVSTYSLADSDVFVELISAGDQSMVSIEAYPLDVYLDAANRLIWSVLNGTVAAISRVAAVNTTVFSATYDPAVHRWFRIRETAGTTYWETSADSLTWTVRHSRSTPITVTAVRIYFLFGTFSNEANSTEMRIDNFNTAQPSPLNGDVTANSGTGGDVDVSAAGATVNDARSAETRGEISVNDSRDAETRGSILDTSQRAAEARGSILDTNQRASEARGSLIDTNERSAEVRGSAAANDERSAEAMGSESAVDSIDAETHGQIIISENRKAEARGDLITAAERSAEARGSESAVSSRSAEAEGEITSNTVSSDRSAEARGIAVINDSRSAESRGQINISSQRSGEVHASEILSSSRAAETEGILRATDSRSGEVTGAIGDIRIVGDLNRKFGALTLTRVDDDLSLTRKDAALSVTHNGGVYDLTREGDTM